MKKTYNVYSFFGKTFVPTGIKFMTMLFVFSICFLSYSPESYAQAIFATEAEENATSASNSYDPELVLQDFRFGRTADDAVSILKRELGDLNAVTTVPQGVAGEATHASKVYFLKDLLKSNLEQADLVTSFSQSYIRLVAYTSRTFSVNVDEEAIVRAYAGLVN